MKPRHTRYLGTLLAVAFTHASQAATLNWDGSDLVSSGAQGGTGTWNTNTTANWWDGAADVVWPALGGTDDDAIFGGTAGTVTVTTATANDITFNTTGYTLSGGTLTLNGTTPTITNGTGINASISSVIAGSAGLEKDGAGMLTLSGTNTYTGNTVISAGTVVVQNNAAFGANANNISVSSGAALDLGGTMATNGLNQVTRVFTVSGSGVGGTGVLTSTATNSQINAISKVILAADSTFGGSQRWDIRGNTPTFNMAGFTLTKTGVNYIGLIGASISNAGNVVVNEGELNLTFGATFGGIGAPNSVTVNNTGTLGLYQTNNIHGSTLNLNTGSTLRGENGGGTQNTWAGTVNLAGNVTFKADAALNVTGNMSGTANIDKTGAGTLVLAGNNTHNGTTNITAGSLQIDHNNALGAGSSITMSGANSSSLVLGNGVVAGSGKTITISGAGSGGTFGALSTSAGNAGTAEWQGAVTIGALTATRIGTNAGNLLISGNIGESTAGSEIWFRNNLAQSKVILTGSNSFTGSPLIASGITSVASFGNAGSNSPLGQNATIRLGLTNVSGNLTYTGTGETTTKTIDLSSTTGGVILDHSGTNLLKFSSNFTSTGAGPKTLTLQGSTTGVGEIEGSIVNGTGGVTPSTANYAIGATTITLASVNGITNGASISGTGIAPGTTVTAINAGTRVVTLSAATTAAGTSPVAITVAGVVNPVSITKAGSGTWVMSGTNSYTGGTTVNLGTLKLDYSTNDTTKLSDTTAGLTLGGGTVELAGGTHTEIVTSTTLTTGTRSFITRSSGSSVLQLNSVTRNTGATVDFAADDIAKIDNTNTNGIIGGWATVSGNNWAVNSTNAGDGLVKALTSYSLTSVAGDTASNYLNANMTVDSNQTPSAVITTNSLRFDDANARTLTLATGNNIVTTGGIMVTPSVGNNISTITGGTLTLPTAGGTLTFHQNNSAGKLVVGSIVGNNTGVVAIAKTGAGEVEFTNTANTFTGSISVNQGILTLNGNLPTRAGSVTVGNLENQAATLNIKGDLPLAGNQLSVGGAFGATGTVNQTAGTVSFTGTSNQLLIGTTAPNATGIYNLSGGTITTAASTTRGIMIGVNDGIAGSLINATLNLSDAGILNNATGLLEVVRGDSASSYQNSTYNQTGGTSTNAHFVVGGGINGAGTVAVGNGANSIATVSITGGTFSATNFWGLSRANNVASTITIGGTADVTLPAFPTARGAGSTATLYFDGGTLKPSASSTAYLGGLTNAFIQNDGARIDTNGFDISVSQNLLADTTSTGGGFTKAGAGILTMTGSNTYTGNTSVEAGTMSLGNGTTNTALADAADVSIAATASLNLNYAGTDVIDGLTINGVAKAPGIWGSVASGAPNTDPALTGTGTLTVTTGPTASPFETWASSFSLTGPHATFDADPDNDGIQNGLEWLLGGNPTTNSSGILPLATRNPAGDLVLTFTREEDAIASTTLKVQISTDLTAWPKEATVATSSSGPDANGVLITIDESASPDAVTITIPAANAAAGKVFARLHATKP